MTKTYDKMKIQPDKHQILYFLSHPIQYFSPLLDAMDKEFSLEVCYFSDLSVKGMTDRGFGQEIKWDIPLLEGYKYMFLTNFVQGQSLGNKFWDVFNPGVITKLWRYKGKIVIVNGWSYSTNWLIFIFGRLFGKSIWLRAETPLNQELKKSKAIRLIKSFLLKRILFPFFIEKFLYIGKQNKLFYQYSGIRDQKRLIFTPYAVDNARFKKCKRLNLEKKEDFLQKMNIPKGKKIILFSGKYIEKKRPLDLMQAFSKLPNNHNYVLLMLGEGILRSEMEQFIHEYHLPNVILTGFVNQSEITDFYAIADIFVMCSGLGETWGLSVNEAMNFALPIIISDTCGSSFDLVEHGVNGFVFKEGDVNALSSSLEILLKNDDLRNKMGIKSGQIVESYSIPIIVANMKKSFDQATLG